MSKPNANSPVVSAKDLVSKLNAAGIPAKVNWGIEALKATMATIEEKDKAITEAKTVVSKAAPKNTLERFLNPVNGKKTGTSDQFRTYLAEYDAPVFYTKEALGLKKGDSVPKGVIINDSVISYGKVFLATLFAMNYLRPEVMEEIKETFSS